MELEGSLYYSFLTPITLTHQFRAVHSSFPTPFLIRFSDDIHIPYGRRGHKSVTMR